MSSYAYLKHLPVDYIKIDGIFVRDMADDPIDLALVNSINEIAHILDKKTIAEYVENDDILDLLREIGVDYAQGFGIAYPEKISEENPPGGNQASH
jgi:EAL domain-containing protein (putative c-di-GMP-specific phosphodiesterase class I)